VRRWVGPLLLLLAGALLCAAAAVVGEYRFGSPLYLFADVKGKPGAFQGAMTVLDSLLMVLAGTAFLHTAVLLRSNARRPAALPPGVLASRGPEHRVDGPAGGCVAFALLLGWLAFDDLLMVHEWAASKLELLRVPRPWGLDHDVYVFGLYALVALVCFVRMLPVLRRYRGTMWLFLMMLLFAMFSETVDFVPWDRLTAVQQTWLGPIEEGTKFMATLAGALYAHALFAAVEAERG